MSALDKYEYRVKTEQMLEYMEKKQYKKAMEIADTIDWRRVKSVSMLNTVSEIYELNGEFQKSRISCLLHLTVRREAERSYIDWEHLLLKSMIRMRRLTVMKNL